MSPWKPMLRKARDLMPKTKSWWLSTTRSWIKSSSISAKASSVGLSLRPSCKISSLSLLRYRTTFRTSLSSSMTPRRKWRNLAIKISRRISLTQNKRKTLQTFPKRLRLWLRIWLTLLNLSKSATILQVAPKRCQKTRKLCLKSPNCKCPSKRLKRPFSLWSKLKKTKNNRLRMKKRQLPRRRRKNLEFWSLGGVQRNKKSLINTLGVSE